MTFYHVTTTNGICLWEGTDPFLGALLATAYSANLAQDPPKPPKPRTPSTTPLSYFHFFYVPTALLLANLTLTTLILTH